MTYSLNNRKVEITETDMEVGEGARVLSATYVDTGAELTEDECITLEEIYQEELYQSAYEDMCCNAYESSRYDD